MAGTPGKPKKTIKISNTEKLKDPAYALSIRAAKAARRGSRPAPVRKVSR